MNFGLSAPPTSKANSFGYWLLVLAIGGEWMIPLDIIVVSVFVFVLIEFYKYRIRRKSKSNSKS